jgi:hypothetical protein
MWREIMKIRFVWVLMLCAIFMGGIAQAVDLKEAQKIENAVASCTAEIRELLLPFGAKAGFPEVRPQGLENASYHELYKTAARRSAEGSRVMAEFINSNKLPTGVEFSARYFMKRLEIASHEYADQSGNEKVFEFLCKDFAAAADKGFAELRLWTVPEMLPLDNIWHKHIQEGFVPVKEKLALVKMPSTIQPDQAREIWKNAAQALSEVGNAAGIASTKVGVGGLIGMPAWRLRLSIKYFKAACKAAVVEMWNSRSSDPDVWLQACKKLRQDIEIINTEINNFLAINGGNPAEIKPVLYMGTAAARSESSATEIEIKASASDKGFELEIGMNSLKITGIADGPEPAYDIMGMQVGDYARSVRFTLDIDKAPTTDAFGNTNYSKKNRRIFTVMTSKGATAEQVARALAKKVNDARDFRAQVQVESPEDALLTFSHR